MNSTNKPTAADARSSSAECIRIGIIESPLSDGSRVYSVTVRDTRLMTFLELDCISQRHAIALQATLSASIRLNTNIPVK